MEFLKIGIVLLTSLVLLGCGSQTLNDEGMDSKTIDEAASTSGASDSSFTVSSTIPANGATNVSTNVQISLTFSDYLGGYGTGTSTTCSDQIFQLSEDNFTTCIGWVGSPAYSVSGKTITLNTPTLSGSTNYQLKVVPESSDGFLSLTSLGGTSVTTTTVTFTTQ
jgi:hypothetical protein